MNHAMDLNKILKMLKEIYNAEWENCMVFVCAHSSFANLPEHKSQSGCVVGPSLSLSLEKKNKFQCWCLRHAPTVSSVCAGAPLQLRRMVS